MSGESKEEREKRYDREDREDRQEPDPDGGYLEDPEEVARERRRLRRRRANPPRADR